MIDQSTFTPADRHRLIAVIAFHHWQHRGRAEGQPMDDWLAAEREVNAACGLIEPTPRWDAPS